MNVHLIPARTDNYIFVIRESATNTTIVIDPTDAAPVLDFCSRLAWKVSAILLTHHHPDHISGVPEVARIHGAPVWGYADDQHRLPPLSHKVAHGDSVKLGNLEFNVYFTPTHTLGHICYYLPALKALFSGDNLFSMGCGRLFEGTPEMLLKNMEWIRSLPDNTMVYCAHEYTLNNTEFAMSLEPENDGLKRFYELAQSKRQRNEPTVPLALNIEKTLNPFLRWDDPALMKALNMEAAAPVEVITRLRELRNKW